MILHHIKLKHPFLGCYQTFDWYAVMCFWDSSSFLLFIVDVILDLNKQNTETQYDMVDFATNAIMDVTILIPSKHPCLQKVLLLDAIATS